MQGKSLNSFIICLDFLLRPMPDKRLHPGELQHHLDHAIKHAAPVGADPPDMDRQLSLTTALIAVLTAIVL